MSILPKTSYSIFPLLCLTVLVSACSPTAEEVVYPYNEGDEIPALAYLEYDEVYNPESVIPPQCYTKTEGVNNREFKFEVHHSLN